MAGDQGGRSSGKQQVWAWRDAYVAGGDIIVFQLGTAGAGIPAGQVGVTGCIESPYKGLGAFGRDDAGFFFGRERAAASIIERLSSRESGLLIVSGASGAGKSSLLLAGVLPKLAGPQLVLTPAGAPLDRLAAGAGKLTGSAATVIRRELEEKPEGFALLALQAADMAAEAGAGGQEGRQLLVVVDQFEELFTQCNDEGERRAFITALHAAATPRPGPGQLPAARVVLVMRADFEALCTHYEMLQGAVQNRYLLQPMDERQLREAIRRPARQAGADADDDLVDQLVREVRPRAAAGLSGPPGVTGGDSEKLPLLSYALDQAWRKKTGRVLRLADYERIGAMEGSISASAEEAYGRLSGPQQDVARQVFIRLTVTGVDGGLSAARATRAELGAVADAADVSAVVTAFAGGEVRLLTVGSDFVVITHEALLRSWPRLAEWLDGDLGDRVRYSQVTADARTWDQGGRGNGYIYPPERMAEIDEAATRWELLPGRYPPDDVSTAFLSAGRQAARRERGRRRRILAAVSALAVVTTIAAVTAGVFGRVAVGKSRLAESRETTSQSEAMAAEATSLLPVDGPLAMLLSLKAYERAPTLQARSAVIEAAQQPVHGLLVSGSPILWCLAFSPDGRTLAAGDFTGHVFLWDLATRKRTRTLTPGGGSTTRSVAFSPDGSTLAASANNVQNGHVGLWDVATGKRVGDLNAGSQVLSVAFSPDGSTLAAGETSGHVGLWDVATGKRVGDLNEGSLVQSVAFSPDGRTLAAGDDSGHLFLWDAVTGRRTRTLAEGSTTDPVQSVAFSPDGRTLAAGDGYGSVSLWDVASGQRTRTLAEGSQVWSVAFSPDGRTLAAGDAVGDVGLWDGEAGERAPATLAEGSQVWSVAFSPDGRTLAAGDNVGLWDVASGQRTRTLAEGSTPGLVWSVAFSPDGRTLAAGDGYGNVSLWNAATRQRTRTLAQGNQVLSVAFSPDGRTLAAGDFTGHVGLWDVATGKQIADLNEGNTVRSVAFSPDGRTLAAGDAYGNVGLWDAATRQRTRTLAEGAQVRSVAFSPDNPTILVTGDTLGNVSIWDTAAGQQLASLPEADNGVTGLAFSPDGQVLAIAGMDGDITLLRQDMRNLTRQFFTQLICRKVQANLTQAQWRKYAPGQPYQRTCP